MTESVAVDAEQPSDPTSPSVGAEIVQFRSRNSLNAKVNYARTLAESGLLPSAYRRQPANVLYAIEYGEMLRLSPMAAITGIHIIEGKPCASAAMMTALVRREKHTLRVSFDRDTMTATARLIRKDDPDFVFEAVWTLDRAVTARLCEIRDGKPWSRTKKGEPSNWEKYPVAMLKARAVSEVCRDGCEEVLCGVHYTPEELGAEVDEEGLPTGQVRVEQVEIDWDAEIRKCGNSQERLRALWHTAPSADVKARIAAAAEKAGIPPKGKPRESAKPAEEEAETVDAELVEDEDEPEVSTDPAERAKAELKHTCEENGWDWDTVTALFEERTNAELAEATNVTVLTKFREWLFTQPQADLMAVSA